MTGVGLSVGGIEQLFFVCGAHGALTLAAGGAAFDVLEEGAGGPGGILPGVLGAAVTLREWDGVVVHGFGGGGQFMDRVDQHLLEFSTGGAWHSAEFSSF